ncbi:aldo/keto reductase [Halobaculum sp. MBLA0143]|uniref:aldo/keto reductase n=1 Tax=Halobaculum sp. MBLA0143 TaxID=3079933 RepID=UPI003525B9EE
MLGLGTWENEDAEQCATSVATALEAGYRHVDTAQIYENEAAVGDGIARADVPREDVFLATKVWIDSLAPEDVARTTRESLDRLGVDSVDLLYVHWPARTYEPEATLSAFADLREEGLIDRIGVSNFEPTQLETALEVLDGEVFANQVELHPLLPQPELRAACHDAGVEPVAYSPLARGTVFEVDVLSEIAADHGVSEAQVSLAWLRHHGVTTIPKATSAAHVHDNFESLELTLTDEEVARIDEIERRSRRVDPDFGPWNR